MSKRKAPNLPSQILDAASDWFVEFNEGRVNAGSREEFIKWLRVSPEHVRAYLQISAHWEDARALGNTQKLSAGELIALGRGDGNVVSLERDTHTLFPTVRAVGKRAPRWSVQSPSRRIWAFAASVLVTALCLWLYAQRNLYSTDIGEQRSVKLADGSTLDLNSLSRVRVRFSERRREIELIAGQALFRVAKDKERPFIVRANGTVVRAVGTQFDVYKKSTGTLVTVVEGKVAVSSPASPAAAEPSALGVEASSSAKNQLVSAIILSAGEQLNVTAAALDKRAHADVAAATAWTQKQIIFRDAPLTEVIEEFNRYNTRRMIITDGRLKSLRISGVFSSSEPDSLLRGLDAQGRFHIHETEEGIQISPR